VSHPAAAIDAILAAVAAIGDGCGSSGGTV